MCGLWLRWCCGFAGVFLGVMVIVALGWVVALRCLVLGSGLVFVRRLRFGALWVSADCCLVAV